MISFEAGESHNTQGHQAAHTVPVTEQQGYPVAHVAKALLFGVQILRVLSY